MKRIAAYTGTKNIYSDMVMSAKSLIANSAVDEVHFFIEDDTIEEENLPDIIICHNVSNQKYYAADGPNMTSPFSYMAMLRIAMCHYLPYKTALLLDCDTVVLNDATPIWDIDLEGYYFSSTPELHRSMHGILYCNFGVVYYNLAKLRDGKADECIKVLNERKFTWVEQDVCNCLCQGYIHEMPTIYNVTEFTCRKEPPKPVIKHYAGQPRKNWVPRAKSQFWRNISWEEVMKRHNKMVEKYS